MRTVSATRIVAWWVAVVGPVVGVLVVIGLGALTGWPGWWVSLMVVAAIAAVGYVVIGRRGSGPPRLVVAAMGVAVVAASAGTVAAAAVNLHDDRELTADRAELRRVAGDLVCRLLTTGTDADRVRARAAATGELAARLRSGSAAVDTATSGTTTRCTPVRTGLGAVGTDAADVVVAANLTERAGSDQSASGRVVAAHLERSDGTWRVATLDLIR